MQASLSSSAGALQEEHVLQLAAGKQEGIEAGEERDLARGWKG